MRNASRLVGATLVYPAACGPPDLVLALQFLLDDLRAEGRRVSALRLGGRSLRLRVDAFDVVLSEAAAPLPRGAFDGLLRPADAEDGRPDLARIRLARLLSTHGHALGFLLRRRGALADDSAGAALALARDGRRLLLPLIEAATPSLLIWQPGGLVLGVEEFLALDPAVLTRPGDPASLLRLGRLAPRQRPEVAPVPRRPPPASRLERAARCSAGHVFGNAGPRAPVPLPRIEAPSARLSQALRDDTAPAAPRRPAAHRAARLAVLALWCALLPQVGQLPALLAPVSTLQALLP